MAAVKITFSFLQVGLGHNQQDFANCKQNALQYWEILLGLRQDVYPYLG